MTRFDQLNKIHHSNFLDNSLEDKCGNLIIADPPYYQTKGSFDFIWEDFDSYLLDVEKWAIECKRLLSNNGTLFWYGSAKNIAYSQIILDKHFNLLNCLVWDKGSFMGLEESDGLKTFPPCTERILMYSSLAHDATGLDTIEKEYIAPLNPFAIELKKARLKKAVTINQVAEYGKFYGNVNHGGSVTNWEKGYNIPLQWQWDIICEHLPVERSDYSELRQEYDQLRQDYEHMRRPFDNMFKLQEILRFKNEAAATGSKYDHDTVKPETLTRALILTCSKKDDLVVVPFSGSGTECAMATKEQRRFIGFDLKLDYVNMSNKRVEPHLKQQKLL